MCHGMQPASQLPASTVDEVESAWAVDNRAGVPQPVGGRQCLFERGWGHDGLGVHMRAFDAAESGHHNVTRRRA